MLAVARLLGRGDLLRVFAPPPLVYFLFTECYRAGPVWKELARCAAVILVLDTIPVGLRYLTYNKYLKYLPVNFDKTINFLASHIRAHGHGERRRIFIDGVPQAKDTSVFLIVGEFLRHEGVTRKEFDAESDLEPTCPIAPVIVPGRCLSESGAYLGGPAPTPVRGDYRVVSPGSGCQVTDRYLDSPRAGCRLVFATRSPLALPAYTAKTLVKQTLARRLTAEHKVRPGFIVSENLFQRPDFYVFVHR